MKTYVESSIPTELEEGIRSWKKENAELVLFLGAGATNHPEYGLPLGSEIAEEILRKKYGQREEVELYKLFYNEYEESLTENYLNDLDPITFKKLINALNDGNISEIREHITLDVIWLFIILNGGKLREIPYLYIDLIEKKLNPEPIPPQYNIIADLLYRSENVIAVFTTNFDEKIDDAIKRAGKELHIYCENLKNVRLLRTNEEIQYWRELTPRNERFLIKLHGTISNPSTIISDIKSLKNLSDVKQDFLKRYLTQSTLGRKRYLIVVGYSAKDIDVKSGMIKALSETQQRISGIFWCSKRISDETNNFINELKKYTDVRVFENVDSFVFLRRLKDVLLGVWDIWID